MVSFEDLPYDPRYYPAPIPGAGIFDNPAIAVNINTEWVSHIDGLLGRLLHDNAWIGTEEEIYAAKQEVLKLMVVFGNQYSKKILDISGLIAYWPLWELSGTLINDISGHAHNGTSVGFDLNQAGIGDGRTSVYLEGTNDYGNVYSTGLNSDFNGQEGTACVWAKVSSNSIWTDATARAILRIGVNSNNEIRLRRSTVNDTLNVLYVAGGTSKSTNISIAESTNWFHLAMTWSKSGDFRRAYLNGTQLDSQTGLGTWTGSLASTICVIGSLATTPSSVWSGNIAHAAIWNTPLTATQIAGLASVP